MPATWTDDRVDLLCRLWRDGRSASEISRALGGVTRNAVIGKVHRLGLAGRGRPSAPGVKPACAATRLPKRRCRPLRVRPARAAQTPPPRPPEVGMASVVSIRRGQCRWPIGEPSQPCFSLCGRPAVRGAYCGGHAALAYRPLSTRPPRDHLLRLAGLA